MLSKGECTIAYANAPKDVRVMCRLCINKTCPGPYLYGDWERNEDRDTLLEVEQAMKLAQNTKPKHLKISAKKKRVRNSFNRKEAAFLLEVIKRSEAAGEKQTSEMAAAMAEMKKMIEKNLSP